MLKCMLQFLKHMCHRPCRDDRMHEPWSRTGAPPGESTSWARSPNDRRRHTTRQNLLAVKFAPIASTFSHYERACDGRIPSVLGRAREIGTANPECFRCIRRDPSTDRGAATGGLATRNFCRVERFTRPGAGVDRTLGRATTTPGRRPGSPASRQKPARNPRSVRSPRPSSA